MFDRFGDVHQDLLIVPGLGDKAKHVAAIDRFFDHGHLDFAGEQDPRGRGRPVFGEFKDIDPARRLQALIGNHHRKNVPSQQIASLGGRLDRDQSPCLPTK